MTTAALVALMWGEMAAAQQPSAGAAPPPFAPPAHGLPALEEAMLIKVPYEQSITVQFPGATRAVSVNPEIVQAALLPNGAVELRALAFGRTFIHVWTPSGRMTRPVQVVQPPPQRSTLEEERLAAERLARHLTIEYQNRYRLLQRGPHLDQVDLNTSTQFVHDLTAQMESPYGDLRGFVSYQRFNSVSELSSWNASISDGDIGPLERFAVSVGDTSVGFSDLTMPDTSLRGVQASYYDIEPYNVEFFHGRRRLGLNAALSLDGNADDDLFFTGARLQDLGRPWTWDVAYATASGEDRVEIQTSQAMEAGTWYWPDERLGFGAEVGRTQEDAYGFRLKSAVRAGTFNLDAVYRNLSQRYENLLGSSGDQGERGLLLTSRQQPFRNVRLRQSLDVFQDRLFVNPEEPDEQNVILDLDAGVDLTPTLLWDTQYSRQKLLGRLFPTDMSGVRTGLRQRLGGGLWLLSNGSVFGDYQFRDFRSASAPESDFTSHSVVAGIGAPLGDYFYWQASQQVGVLEERNGATSHPRESSAGINYTQRFKRVPVSLRSGVNYSTASGLGSPNSLLTDQHRAAWDTGVRYDVTRNSHVFFDSRLSRRSATGVAPEYEIDLETGMRVLLDTGITWDPSASVSGIVFQDVNADGSRQPSETGLPRVAVTTGPVGGAGERRAVTDPGGRFYLGRVRGRRAVIAVALDTVPAGYVPTTPGAIDVDLKHPPDMPLFFGFVAQSELRVRVFIDGNGNGAFDAGDVPLDGVRLSLEGGGMVETDRGGWGYFRGVNPGMHRVTLSIGDLAAGYVPTTVLTQERALAEGQIATIEFPVLAERSISGRVYVDVNRNGRFDEEPVLAGLPVCLDESARAQTREDGRYLFKDVAAGTHRVSLNCGAPLDGYLPLASRSPAVNVPPQAVRLEQDFPAGETDVVMLDITADVLRARQSLAPERDAAIDEVIARLDAASAEARGPEPVEPLAAPEQPADARRPATSVSPEVAGVDIVVEVR